MKKTAELRRFGIHLTDKLFFDAINRVIVDSTMINAHNVTVAAKLFREDDKVAYSDSGYLGLQKRVEVLAYPHLSAIDYRINRRTHSLPKVSDSTIDWERLIEHRKSSIRRKVEHTFRIIKCQFGFTKMHYRSLKKNENRLSAMFACANLYAVSLFSKSGVDNCQRQCKIVGLWR